MKKIYDAAKCQGKSYNMQSVMAPWILLIKDIYPDTQNIRKT